MKKRQFSGLYELLPVEIRDLRTSGVRKTRKKSRNFLVKTVISGFTKLLRNTQNSDMNKFKVGK